MLGAKTYYSLIDKIRARRRAYQLVFLNQDRKTINPAADQVMKDLNEFCRGTKTTANVDTHVAAMMEGRRQVLLRIWEHLHLPSEQLFRLYGGTVTGATADE